MHASFLSLLPEAPATRRPAQSFSVWCFSRIRTVLTSPYFWLGLAVIVVFFAVMESAHAAEATAGGGQGLPWESPLEKIRKSFSGPVAFTFALVGIIVCGATLIWGGEVSEFARRLVYLVLVICLIVFANNLLTGVLFSGAMVPHNAVISSSDLADYAKAHAVAGIVR